MENIRESIKVNDKRIPPELELKVQGKDSSINAHVAQLIYHTRTQAGLSQKKLAQMINTTQSVISRLEDADYEGHSLSMLSRIAQAMEREVKIEFILPKISQTT